MASGVEIFTGLKSPIGILDMGRYPGNCKAVSSFAEPASRRACSRRSTARTFSRDRFVSKKIAGRCTSEHRMATKGPRRPPPRPRQQIGRAHV